MIRVHLTIEDVLDTAFVSAPEPLLETVLAFAQLQRRDGSADLAGWRRRQGAALPRAALALVELIPPTGHGPFFLDLPCDDLEYGLELMHATPTADVVAELQRTTGSGRPGAFVRAVAARDPEAWRTLDAAMRAAHRAMIQPVWNRLCSAYAADIAHRVGQIAREGLRRTLAGLFPGSRLRGMVWEIDRPSDLDIWPGGRGIRLMPSVVWSGEALVNSDSCGRTVLIYPALRGVPDLAQPVTDDPLSVLLGRTRAALLRELTDERTTSHLSTRLKISNATLSEHAKALRRAGLVQTRRAGKTVRHSSTSLGDQLIAGNLGARPADLPDAVTPPINLRPTRLWLADQWILD